MANKIKVAVLGACGKMGSEVVKTVVNSPDTELVGACDVVFIGNTIKDVLGIANCDVVISDDYNYIITNNKPDVVVDFAKPFDISKCIFAMENGVVPIIGTTGQSKEDTSKLEEVAKKNNIGAMLIPNFAIGAVLMMKFAYEAAKYMGSVEIIELHHDKKADAPSGTAIKTASMIEEARKESGIEYEPIGMEDRARGELHYGVPVHSVRLTGLVAHQEVVFGGQGQSLSIRHDSIDRTSFMPGVLITIRKAKEIKGFVYGLDKLL
ncbi:MAG: 4-hydroxy-tetrahydrodipicolinate reductase [Armatimonadota bacterium]